MIQGSYLRPHEQRQEQQSHEAEEEEVYRLLLKGPKQGIQATALRQTAHSLTHFHRSSATLMFMFDHLSCISWTELGAMPLQKAPCTASYHQVLPDATEALPFTPHPGMARFGCQKGWGPVGTTTEDP